jgi:hypothetical protein
VGWTLTPLKGGYTRIEGFDVHYPRRCHR